MHVPLLYVILQINYTHPIKFIAQSNRKDPVAKSRSRRHAQPHGKSRRVEAREKAARNPVAGGSSGSCVIRDLNDSAGLHKFACNWKLLRGGV